MFKMVRKRVIKKKEKTFVITAAQGIQNPYSARSYGRDISKGAPNIPLIKNIESYVEANGAELHIQGINGANCNEIELHPFFEKRDDVYMDVDSKKRNLQNRVKEQAKRDAWDGKTEKWEAKQEKDIDKDKVNAMKATYGDEWDGKKMDEGLFETMGIQKGDCPMNMPMHYFWENIPDNDRPTIGKRLNSNISTPTRLSLTPQSKKPFTGINFVTKRYGGNSVILASPKRMMQPVAQGASGEYPHMMITSGVCTRPNYNLGKLGISASEDHAYGFAVVNVLDDKIYLARIVPAQTNGTFVDLGVKYAKGKNPERAEVSALEIGDSHFMEINPKVDRVNMDMMEFLRPKSTFFNDVFAAVSVSVHNIGSPIIQSQLFEKGLTSLENELVLTGEYIKRNAELAQQWGGDIYIKWSNHDDMLYRWLEKEGYRKDKENWNIANKILGEGPRREDCFEKAVKLLCEIPENVKFLKLGGDDVEVEGYLMSSHGHQGTNGSRGNLKQLEAIYKKVVIGHGHKLEVLHNAISVGTSTNIPLDYQLGNPSTSMAGNAVIYRGGLAQAIPIIKSKWAPRGTLEFLANN